MTRPIIKIFDVSTQQEEIREMNDEEFAIWEADVAANAEREAAQAQADAEAAAAAKAKADAKAAVLAKLGLTQDIIDILAN
jgi:hypothetical protein